jgi:hypothetical protein
MKALILPVAIGLAASLAACDTTNTGSSRSNGGLFGSSTAPSAAATPSQSRAVQRACDPRNVPADQRASVLHQDRPGGSDCPDAVTTPRR